MPRAVPLSDELRSVVGSPARATPLDVRGPQRGPGRSAAGTQAGVAPAARAGRAALDLTARRAAPATTAPPTVHAT